MSDHTVAAVLPAAPGFWEPSPGCDDHYAAFPKERRVEVSDGTPIVYAVRSPRRDAPVLPTLLFSNGWSCSDVYWSDVVPPLVDAGHVCIVPDTRGHGASGLPRPPGRGARNLTAYDLSITRLAADLVEVLDDVGVDEVIVVGHSMGVQTALETYRLARERVVGMVLMAGTYENPLKSFYGTRLAHTLFPISRAVMSAVPEVVRPMWMSVGNRRTGYISARLAGAIGPRATVDGLHAYLLHLAESDPAVLVRAIDAMRRHSARDLLPRIDVPVLVLAAGRDRFTPPKCSADMFQRIPTSEIRWFEHAGHTLPIEEPEAIVDAIQEWCGRRIASAA